MNASLAVSLGSSWGDRSIAPAQWRAGIDFYTVSHNITVVKEFIAEWYKKVKSRR
jgi:hypothetical protein